MDWRQRPDRRKRGLTEELLPRHASGGNGLSQRAVAGRSASGAKRDFSILSQGATYVSFCNAAKYVETDQSRLPIDMNARLTHAVSFCAVEVSVPRCDRGLHGLDEGIVVGAEVGGAEAVADSGHINAVSQADCPVCRHVSGVMRRANEADGKWRWSRPGGDLGNSRGGSHVATPPSGGSPSLALLARWPRCLAAAKRYTHACPSLLWPEGLTNLGLHLALYSL